MSWRTLSLRALAGCALVLLLGGPAPGADGACSGGPNLDRAADLETYCKQRDQLVCVRRGLRKELTLGQTNDCRRTAIQQCELRSWSPGCMPTERQTRACLNALRSLDTLQTHEDQIAECNRKVLCTAPIVRDAGSADGGVGR
jgi:hypothetical protein